MKCPICDKGTLVKGRIKESMFGVFLGEFPAQICRACGESFTDQQTTRKIEEAAKKKRIWGLGKKTRIIKAGNSLAVRIPKNLAEYLNLHDGVEAFIHPDSDKLVIESIK